MKHGVGMPFRFQGFFPFPTIGGEAPFRFPYTPTYVAGMPPDPFFDVEGD
jgi:hypothetical protein